MSDKLREALIGIRDNTKWRWPENLDQFYVALRAVLADSAHPEDAPEGPTVKGEPCDCCGRFTDPVREEHTSDCQYNVDKLCAEIRGIGDRLEVDRLKGDTS